MFTYLFFEITKCMVDWLIWKHLFHGIKLLKMMVGNDMKIDQPHRVVKENYWNHLFYWEISNVISIVLPIVNKN